MLKTAADWGIRGIKGALAVASSPEAHRLSQDGARLHSREDALGAAAAKVNEQTFQ